jgi:hypothetical protein
MKVMSGALGRASLDKCSGHGMATLLEVRAPAHKQCAGSMKQAVAGAMPSTRGVACLAVGMGFVQQLLAVLFGVGQHEVFRLEQHRAFSPPNGSLQVSSGRTIYSLEHRIAHFGSLSIGYFRFFELCFKFSKPYLFLCQNRAKTQV